MDNHEHDWRKQPNGNIHRINKAGEYLTLVRCATCPSEGWAVEHGLVSTWPAWRGQVVDVKDNPTQREQSSIVTSTEGVTVYE